MIPATQCLPYRCGTLYFPLSSPVALSPVARPSPPHSLPPPPHQALSPLQPNPLTLSYGRTLLVSLTPPRTTMEMLNVVTTSFVMTMGEPMTTSSTYLQANTLRLGERGG